jgi:hypothetical protein
MIEMVIRLRCHEGPYMIRQKKVDERIALIPEDSKLWTLYREFEERAAKFREIIDKSLSADCSYELVADCSKAGFRTRRHYPKAHDGDVAFWLYHRLGMWLASGRKAVHHSKKPRKFKVLNPRIPKAFMDLIPKGVLANVD